MKIVLALGITAALIAGSPVASADTTDDSYILVLTSGPNPSQALIALGDKKLIAMGRGFCADLFSGPGHPTSQDESAETKAVRDANGLSQRDATIFAVSTGLR